MLSPKSSFEKQKHIGLNPQMSIESTDCMLQPWTSIKSHLHSGENCSKLVGFHIKTHV